MVKSKSKEMNKYLKLFLILAGVFIFMGLLYGWFIIDAQNKFDRLTGGEEITSSELALTLLNIEEIEKATNLKGSIIPLLPQFNDKLAVEDAEKYGYQDLVARLFLSKNSGDLLIDTAITLFDTEGQAENFLEKKAEETGVKTTKSFEETVLTVYNAYQGDEINPPSATLRFVIQNLVAKITVYGGNPTIDYTNTGLLSTIVISLATEQKKKIEQLLEGKIQEIINIYQTNMAFNNLPNELSNAELIGISYFTQEEWLGETGDLKKSELKGFKSGAMENFKLKNLPGHVLSVVIIEFDNKENALKEQKVFFSEGVHIDDETSQMLKLPKTLNEFSVARISDTMAEMQSVHRLYLYDLALVSPYGKFDKENARELLVKYGEEIFN